MAVLKGFIGHAKLERVRVFGVYECERASMTVVNKAEAGISRSAETVGRRRRMRSLFRLKPRKAGGMSSVRVGQVEVRQSRGRECDSVRVVNATQAWVQTS